MNSYFKIIAVNFSILLLLLVIVEMFFGGWFSAANNLNNLGIIRNTKLEYTQKLYDDSSKNVIYTRDENGLRGISTFNKPEKIDILTIGGSTTDQRYITDTKTWQECLENRLAKEGKNYLISNAGADGQSTHGHIKNFELWFPEIENLKPEYILFYVGVNDFYKISADSKYDNFGKNKISFQEKFKNNSAIYNLNRKIKGVIHAKKANVGHKRLNFKNHSYTDQSIGSPKLIDYYKKHNLTGFKNRVKRLIQLCKDMEAEPIFVTQSSARYKFVNNTLFGINDTMQMTKFKFNGVDFYNLLTLLNEAIYEICDDKYMIIDLTKTHVWRDEDFYDWFHMTPTGAKKLADEIFKELNTKLK